MKRSVWFSVLVSVLIVLFGISEVVLADQSLEGKTARLYLIQQAWYSPESEMVLVVAHRGDWKDAPESSLLSIESCIAKGADIVEIDVRMTKDGQFIVLHDDSLDRTTNGTGSVGASTLAEIRKLRLVHNGKVTDCQVPTLEEALLAIKGRIMVNLDIKTGPIREMVELCQRLGVIDQVIFKQQFFPGLLEIPGLIYMPRVTTMEELKYFLENMHPSAVEIIVPTPDHPLLTEGIQMIKEAGSRVWINALWDGRESGGWGDEQAVQNPNVYGELINRGISIIQTDELDLLINYLRSKNLHLGEPQPAFFGAKIEPNKISNGEVSFKVGVLDPNGDVAKVFAYLRPDWKFYVELNDNGVKGDSIAGDGVWSVSYNVDQLRLYCAEGRPGYELGKSFDWDFYAIGADGFMLKVPGGTGIDVPIMTSAQLIIIE